MLRNRVGATAATMRYGREWSWPAVPDGTGYTLVLADALFDPGEPASWKPSAEPGGTPGVFEQTFRRVAGELILRRGEEWKFFRGRTAAPEGWLALEFDDSGWKSGASGFGYGDGDAATVLEDMRGNYLAVFTRKRFAVAEPAKLSFLTLQVDFDDGFIAYLNGKEVARSNVAPAGGGFSWDAPASGLRGAGRSDTFPIGMAKDWLRSENVLCVAGFNRDVTSSDFSLNVELENRPERAEEGEQEAARPLLNEVALRFDGAGSTCEWVEVYNPSARPLDLGGYFLSDDPASLTKWRIPPGVNLSPRGFAALAGKVFSPRRLGGDAIFLTAPDGVRIAGALSLRGGRSAGASGSLALGRYPDGDRDARALARPTPGEPNDLVFAQSVVIHEIHYHPRSDDPAEEFIELHNPGPAPVDLDGLSLCEGVRYAFRSGETIPPAGFLVVARDPGALARRYGLTPAEASGPFEGTLSDRGETIRLCDGSGRTVDVVSYADRAPWPHLADGWGATLERIDPRVAGRLAGAWAASDESRRCDWEDVRYESVLRSFRGLPASSFQLLLLDAGECLVDNVRILDEDGKPLVEETFDGEAGRWRSFGTHLDSGAVRDSPYSTSPCYRIVATGRGNSRHNYVSLDLDAPLAEGATYTVSFRARWLNGSPLLLARTAGQGLARTHRLGASELSGTPGRVNSRSAPLPPVVGVPRQRPVAPRSDQPVTFEVPISSSAPIAFVELRYRPASESEWRAAPLERRGALVWMGELPALPKGRIEFFVAARDAEGREGFFPAGGSDRPAQFAVDLLLEPAFPAYTVLVSDREWEMFRRRERMGNRLMDATLVYGTSRIFYNVGFRTRGSGFTRGSGNWRLVFGAETLDGRRELTFDAQGRDPAKANERLTFWLLDQIDVPTPRQRYVHLTIAGRSEESGLYEDVEKVNSDFLARWFPDGLGGKAAAGRLHKVDDYWDFPPPSAPEVAQRDERGGAGGPPGVPRGPGGGFGRRGAFPFGGGFRGRNGTFVEAFLAYDGPNSERYRWNFPPRANGPGEDFGPLLELIELADPDETPNAEFLERAESVIAVDQWTRVLAGRTLANDWDSYGLSRGKNAYLYRAPSGRWHLLPWDSDLSWGGRGFRGFAVSDSLIGGKFPAVRRLLEQPAYRRRFLSSLAFLAAKRLEPESFAGIVRELEEHVGVGARYILDAAEANRRRILAQLPEVELQATMVERVSSGGILRVRGTAPLLASAFHLNGREGTCRFQDERNWTGEFVVRPEDGEELILEALDRDGERVAAVAIAAP